MNIWKAINWKGEYNDRKESECVPTDEEFKQYFENTLNSPDNPSCGLNDFVLDTTIPVFDEAMTPYEVQNQVKMLKSNKAPYSFQVFTLIVGHRQNWLQYSRRETREMLETIGV